MSTFFFALRDGLEDKFLPSKANETDTGYDLRCASYNKNPIVIKPNEYFKIPLGFRAYLPEGWYYELHPRSSSFAKKFMHNLIGIIDEDFPLETMLCGQYIPPPNNQVDLVINYGDAIAQMIPRKREDILIVRKSNEEMDQMIADKKSTRIGGIGSTG